MTKLGQEIGMCYRFNNEYSKLCPYWYDCMKNWKLRLGNFYFYFLKINEIFGEKVFEKSWIHEVGFDLVIPLKNLVVACHICQSKIFFLEIFEWTNAKSWLRIKVYKANHEIWIINVGPPNKFLINSWDHACSNSKIFHKMFKKIL